MRYQPEHKLETHQKIVKDASRRVRAEGLNGAAVVAVMRDTGLTHGGFYKHFGSKDDLLVESLSQAFREFTDDLVRAAEQSPPGEAWKTIVKTYLRPELCDHPERGCPLAALAPELARVDKRMKPQIVTELVNYKSRMVPFMPGMRTVDKERAFFAIFSTMIGAIEIARMLPDPGIREKVLGNARDFLPDAPIAHEGFFATHFFTVKDQEKSKDFYVRILVGKVIKAENPCYIKLANTWIILNSGGGPTPDKPGVFLETPLDLNRVNSFLNLRVADIWDCYKQWGDKGAIFLTEPLDNHGWEWRCYMRDPDGYLIEVGQYTQMALDRFKNDAT